MGRFREFLCTMADAPKKRTFRKFSFRGVDLDALLDMSDDAITAMLNARQRRKKSRHGHPQAPRAPQASPQGQARVRSVREAGDHQDAPPWHDRRARDVPLRGWCLQRKTFN